ncbi:MAG TPA: prepilin-type N-terminal cleavage/methylation domain-containing protein [Thermodesulfovibrionales bacterium]|nr:prepilin-type N-terminal cleavage/methylation domain-containing protein [Thermodesulfovibrionales bacterium]
MKTSFSRDRFRLSGSNDRNLLDFDKAEDCGIGYPTAIGAYADKKSRGFTLVELLAAIVVIGILAGIGIVSFLGYKAQGQIDNAISDIAGMSVTIKAYETDHGVPPDGLNAVNLDKRLDPWGNPYQYYNIVTAKGKGQMRKDHNLVPINSDFDLYSMGPDGQSQSPLTAKVSRDDIIRANDGAYIGPAYAY